MKENSYREVRDASIERTKNWDEWSPEAKWGTRKSHFELKSAVDALDTWLCQNHGTIVSLDAFAEKWNEEASSIYNKAEVKGEEGKEWVEIGGAQLLVRDIQEAAEEDNLR
ncbi:MAG: hypothetical protein CEN88_208 [Candidatus Berkelbacteria bacterium Licking1014_2]|uniref:Uncharacterized protein n=1 Tax=Candidatus Berkelbacteria bacterium Licking1014_2 TaxID=2017146 RepID=A0A554LW13_9BACT|nr:MAG: hypothetical protein CEN88_208 [Candidatus Berkelbacteria bacterium Licking1014_2]